MSDEHIAVGRRSLLCGEITKAVESFQKACELIATEHGDLDDRLAEPNLLYGSALLELARMEGPVLGNALDGVPEEDDSDGNEIIEKGPEMTADEKEDLSNQVIDAMCEESKEETDVQGKEETEETENTEKTGEEGDGDEEEGASSDNEEDATAEDEPTDAVKSPSAENGERQVDGMEKDEKEGGESDSDSEDVSNLQLAWEVIEVAKQIFSRSESRENKLKVADCLEKLAEISREKEDYEQAIMDLQDCMSIRSTLLASESREIAETHFQIGTTHAVAGKLESASLAFHSALKCLQQYSAKLKLQIDEVKEGEDVESLRSALKDIEELIPDVERRCVEVDEDRVASVPDTKVSPPTANKKENIAPGDDISHLIRKKRPVTDGSEAKEANETKNAAGSNGTESAPVNKKAKIEGDEPHEVKSNGDEVNGSAKADTMCH